MKNQLNNSVMSSTNNNKEINMRVLRIQDAPMKSHVPCQLCGNNKHAAAIPTGSIGSIYVPMCLSCITQEGEAHELVVTGRAPEAAVVEPTYRCGTCFKEVEVEGYMCKSCYAKSISTRTRATCQVCRSQHEGLNNVCQYCAAIADAMGMTIKEAMHSSDVVMRGSRANLIHKRYGYRAVLNPSLMERDRNYSSVAFEAGRCGLNVSDVCDNFEQDMLNRTYEGYEAVADDFMSYDAPVRGITRDVLSTIKGMSTEELEMNLPADEHESKVYEESTYRRVSKEQRECNFEYYTKRAAAASTKVEREQLRAEVEQGIANSMITFTVEEDGEEVEITAPIFFPKGKTTEFFAILNKDRDAEREAAYGLYMAKLNEVSSYTELAALGQDVYQASKEAEVSFVNNEGETVRASLLFAKGMSAQFWANYKEVKEAYSIELNDKVKAIAKGIKKLDSEVELKRAKQKIYSAELTYASKKELWALCNKRILGMKLSA